MGGVCLCEGLVGRWTRSGVVDWYGCWGFVNLQLRLYYYREVSWKVFGEVSAYSQDVNVLKDGNRTRRTTNPAPNM